MRVSPKLFGLTLATLVLLGVVAYFVGLNWYGHHHRGAAHRALARRDFRAAITHLKSCLWVWPDDRELNLLTAQAYRRGGELEAAARQLGACERKRVWEESVSLEHDLQRLQRGDLTEAARLLARSFEQPNAEESPLIAEAVLEGWTRTLPAVTQAVEIVGTAGADVMSLTGRAIDLWLRSRPSDADQAQGLAWRARMHALIGEQDAAVALLQKALDLHPDCFDARLWLAQLIAQQSPLVAIDHYRVLFERDPGNWSIRLGLASGLRGVGRLEDARPLLDDLVAAGPNEPAFLVERALLDLDLGRPAQGEDRLRAALVVAPNNPDVLLALSRCLQAAGKASEAKQYYLLFQRAQADKNRGADKRPRGAPP